jgi:hypothetical protein
MLPATAGGVAGSPKSGDLFGRIWIGDDLVAVSQGDGRRQEPGGQQPTGGCAPGMGYTTAGQRSLDSVVDVTG